jgi:hypothetical protein
LLAKPNPVADRRTSEVSVDSHRPAKSVEDTGEEDAPLAMTEGRIKPERLGRQTDDETPPTPAAEQHCSDRTHEYRGLGGKLEPRPSKWTPSRYRLLTGGSRMFLHLPRRSRGAGFVARNTAPRLFAHRTGDRLVPRALDGPIGRHVSLASYEFVSSGTVAPRVARQAVPTNARRHRHSGAAVFQV